MPSSFWSLKQNGQWSVETMARSLVRRPFHRSARCGSCLRAQRRRADPLGALEAGRAELVLEGQVEVLRAGLGEHVAALVAGLGDLFERLAGGQVHDVERAVGGDAGQPDRPAGRLGLERLRPGEAVVDRVGLAARERLLHQHVDGRPVLGVHHDHRAVAAGLLHRPQDLAVVAVEDARVGHEQLEAGDALVGDELVHRLERVVVDAAEDHVEGVVDVAVALRPSRATRRARPARPRRCAGWRSR